MSKIRKIIRSIIVMAMVSVLCLFFVSLLAYGLRWNADTAMIVITSTYILSGFLGGSSFGWKNRGMLVRTMENIDTYTQKNEKNLIQKMFDACLAGTGFMMLLLLLSIFYFGDTFAISTRFFVIWLTILGSASLGRVLC